MSTWFAGVLNRFVPRCPTGSRVENEGAKAGGSAAPSRMGPRKNNAAQLQASEGERLDDPMHPLNVRVRSWFGQGWLRTGDEAGVNIGVSLGVNDRAKATSIG